MAKQPERRSHYIPHARVVERGEVRNHVTGEVTRPPSRTKQEFKKESDVNNIIKAFSQRGMTATMLQRAQAGAFVDLPDPMDFQESLAQVEQASKAFMELPAKVRDRFHNEPIEFLQFMGNPDNEKEARDMGLLVPLPEVPPPVKVEVVSQAPAVDNSEKK